MPITAYTPTYNTDALIQGNAEFTFNRTATTLADAIANGFDDIGHIHALKIDTKLEKIEHEGSYRGVRRIDKVIGTLGGVEYLITSDEWDKPKVRYALMGEDDTDITQTACGTSTAATTWDFNLSTVEGVIGRWYDIIGAIGLSNAGKQILDATEVTIAVGGADPPTLVEGTDYVVDYKLGRVKFLNTVNANTAMTRAVAPSYKCGAIIAGDAGAMLGFIPLNQLVTSGWGNLFVFDDHHANKVVFKHVHFSCDIYSESIGNLDGKSLSEIALRVRVTGTPGTAYTAE